MWIFSVVLFSFFLLLIRVIVNGKWKQTPSGQQVIRGKDYTGSKDKNSLNICVCVCIYLFFSTVKFLPARSRASRKGESKPLSLPFFFYNNYNCLMGYNEISFIQSIALLHTLLHAINLFRSNVNKRSMSI